MPGRSVLKPTDGAPDAPQPADLGGHDATAAPGNGVLEGEVTQPGEQPQPPPPADEPHATVYARLGTLESDLADLKEQEALRDRALVRALKENEELIKRVLLLERELGIGPAPAPQLAEKSPDDEVAKAQAILDREQDARVDAASEEEG